MQKISVVTSLYRSAEYVNEFYERHLASLKRIQTDYEFVFVDDGYPDEAKAKVKNLIRKDPKVKLVCFSRNFGQYPAMFAGMAHATGDWIYTTDSDLEEAPENIELFWKRVSEKPEIDFLYGVVNQRSGGFIKGMLGGFFHRLMQWGSDVRLPKNISWQILMRKEYVKSLLLYKEAETLPAGIMMLTGFVQEPFLIEKSFKGVTSYTFKKRMKLALNAITAFSSKPLIFIGLVGILITILSFVAIIVAIIIKMLYVDYQTGWISIILSIWFVGGLILSSVGITGLYVAKIFNQVKSRPLYIVSDIITNQNLD